MGKEKKEIGMEKLIELLNEYVEETDFGDNLDEYNEAEILDEETLEVNGEYHDIEYLYTKKFGFIKWLVENDKIDKKKLDEAERRPMYVTDDMFSLYKIDECVIMLLSISDTPIEDLISYLK